MGYVGDEPRRRALAAGTDNDTPLLMWHLGDKTDILAMIFFSTHAFCPDTFVASEANE